MKKLGHSYFTTFLIYVLDRILLVSGILCCWEFLLFLVNSTSLAWLCSIHHRHLCWLEMHLAVSGEGNGTPLSTLAWKIPWTEEPGSPWGHYESDMTERLHFPFSLLCIGEGNGNPLQCSCLENPRDGVSQSRTRLKWLSSSSSCQ